MNHYFKDVQTLKAVDVYRVLVLFDVKSHPIGHAIKKLLCAGKRGAKDYRQDLLEAKSSIERELAMMDEEDQGVSMQDEIDTLKKALGVNDMSENNSVGEHPLERELDCGTAINEPHEFIPKYVFFSERINTKPKGVVVVKNCNIQNIPQTQECYFGITESKDGSLSVYIKGVSITPNQKNIITVNFWLAKILRFLRLAI